MVPVATGSGTRPGVEISLFAPVSFDEAIDIVGCLRGRAATTISLDKMKRTDASRLVDFVSGASQALDGDFHKLTDHVYLFCPSNMKIVAPVKTSVTKSGANALDYLFTDWKNDRLNGSGIIKS
jgi:cell division inhibitor SepF